MRYLKRFVLQGFKTFANRTEFAFDDGITAIVGPNGSGKSNISDALQWVLGEQSYVALRARRSEDMIFSGSEQRARLGMAAVWLTFDNSSGWLPTEYSEVEICRRAYRAGENEYYLNGNRVRLRDVVELLGTSGLSERNYTVIGQGLIDQALSLRPEERRRLFEEAAGITIHQSKRDLASRQLAEARANLTRAQDIITELTPHLHQLEAQAQRALSYQSMKADLERHLMIWYGYRWHNARTALETARSRAACATQSAEAQAARLQELLAASGARQAERDELRDRLSEWHRASSEMHRRAEAAQREMAVATEQGRLLGQQIEDLQRDAIGLRAAAEDAAARLCAAEAELSEADQAHVAQVAMVAEAKRNLAERERARVAGAASAAQAEESLHVSKTHVTDRRARLAQLAERRLELTRQTSQGREALAAASQELGKIDAQLQALEGARGAAAAAQEDLKCSRTTLAQHLAEARQAERLSVERLNGAQRALSRLQDQKDLLSRLRDEGAGLNAGSRAILSQRGNGAPRGAPSGQPATGALRGIMGALGDLIQVPPELDRAMEAALGGRLQDIVVRTWKDAEAAVAFLKQSRAGRATFLPLDTLRPGHPTHAPVTRGVLGVASDLVTCDPDVRPAIELALNHVVVVQDLPTARVLLSRDGHATLVTVDGDIVRPGGSVTGGSEGTRRDSGILSRARELRALPQQIAAAEADVRETQGQVATARHAQAQTESALAALRSQEQEAAAGQERLTAEHNRLQLARERAKQDFSWRSAQEAQGERELSALAERERQLAQDATQLDALIQAQEAAVAAARAKLLELNTDDAVATLARLRAQAELSARQHARIAARADELRGQEAHRRAEVAAREAKIEALQAQQSVAAENISRGTRIAQELADKINELARLIDPTEARLAEIEGRRGADEAEERTAREGLRLAQMRQDQAALALQRAQDEASHLLREIEKELGPATLESQELAGPQPELASGESKWLPAVADLPEGLDRDIRNLRAEISRLGPVNPEAPAQHAEVEARYSFLTGQSADLQKAVATLEELIAELNRLMEREFVATFKAVAAQFRDEFTGLFGGGSARLSLVDPNDPNASGIDISVRPPGKREQGLALLSGGERALTAAALVFSILKIRPAPFCLLDEVDAALDEANARRFRDALRGLAGQTQFILITHNRISVEASDTVYGISMGADSTSQVLSLRLDGHEVSPGSVDKAVSAANVTESPQEGGSRAGEK
jgi:chromosome segregation protein